MPFSHHSHSGQFCFHAQNTLEEMIQTAIFKNMRVFALTEHMPRDQAKDLYPEEIAAMQTPFDLFRLFADYFDAALILRAKYQSQIHILIGFEIDYIRPSSIALIRSLQQTYKFDFFVGSVHHVATLPIDFDRNTYEKAREAVGGTEQRIFEQYFDDQFEMLSKLEPPVVGHWDLIRLFCDQPEKPLRDYGEGVWNRLVRNVEFVVGYGGLAELNSAALRKGWNEPYPRRDVCQLIMEKGGRFTLSDDSHCVSQIGQNYHLTLRYMETLRLDSIHYLERLPMGEMAVNVLGACAVRKLTLQELKMEKFWQFAGASNI